MIYSTVFRKVLMILSTPTTQHTHLSELRSTPPPAFLPIFSLRRVSPIVILWNGIPWWEPSTESLESSVDWLQHSPQIPHSQLLRLLSRALVLLTIHLYFHDIDRHCHFHSDPRNGLFEPWILHVQTLVTLIAVFDTTDSGNIKLGKELMAREASWGATVLRFSS